MQESRWTGPGAAGPVHLACAPCLTLRIRAPAVRRATAPPGCITSVTNNLFLSHMSRLRGSSVTASRQPPSCLNSASFTGHRLSDRQRRAAAPPTAPPEPPLRRPQGGATDD
ncbi:hypothetical protein GCM10009837_12730 [Streptomyces durmitorensis]